MSPRPQTFPYSALRRLRPATAFGSEFWACGRQWLYNSTAVLLWDWTYPIIGIRINGLTSVKGSNTDLKSQNTVTEWTV